MSDSEIIDYYYNSAVSGIKESWFTIGENENWYNHIINLPDKERITYLVAILDEEVSNGGFNQYFINGYGQFATVTVKALQLIEANETAELLESARKEINVLNYDDITFRKKLISGEIDALYEDERLESFLESIDDEYSEYSNNIGELLGKFLRT